MLKKDKFSNHVRLDAPYWGGNVLESMSKEDER